MAGAAVVGILGLVGTTAVVVAAVVNFVVAFGVSYLLAKNMGKSGTTSAADYKQTLQSDKAAQRVLYGQRQLSFVMNFAEEQQGTQDINDETGESHELLYLSGMICNHEVSAIGTVWLDDKVIGDYNDRVSIAHVNGTGVIPSFLLNETAQYEPSMTGGAGYWVALKLKHDSELFSGVPTVKVLVSGKKIKDYRTGQMIYSNNAALVLADFYVNYMKIPESRLMMTGSGSFIAAANMCDEATETGERRYEINGMFELDQKPSDIINEMLLSCGGTLIRTNGLIGLLPAAYYGGGQLFDIVESDIVGAISITPEESMGDCANVMSGTYISPSDDYSEQDFTPIRDENAILRDGQEITEDITYNFVTNAMQAQRLASIEQNRRSAGGFTELTLSPKGAYCRIGRVVNLELEQFGISGTYRITSQAENDDLTFTIKMQKDDLAIYDDNVGEPYSPPPTLDLGSVGIAAPSGLQFITTNTDSVGNTIQGALTWQGNSSSVKYYDVYVYSNADGSLVQAGQTRALIYNLNALKIGGYTAKVRAVNDRGETSGYATNNFSVGQPSAPADWYLRGFEPDDGKLHTVVDVSNWNIEVVPNVEGGTPQGTLFEFWYLADSASHIKDEPTHDENDRDKSDLISIGSSLNKGSLTPDRWAHFWVRSINSYGKSDFIYIKTWTISDQSLVVTMVEKLVAVEIESQNWNDTSNIGYKLFSPASPPYELPDGNVLENPDGLAVFNNIIARGGIYATFGEFSGEIKGATGTFSGTIFADKIRGDVTSTNGKAIPKTVMYNGRGGGTVISGTLVTYTVAPQPKTCFVVVQLPIAYEMIFASQMMCQFSVNGGDWTQNLAPIYGIKLSAGVGISIRLRYLAQNMGVGNVTFERSFTTCTVSFAGDSVAVI